MKEIEKEIDSLIAKRSNFTTILIILVSGIVSLFFSFKSIYIFPIALGFFFILFFIKGLVNTEKRVNKLIRELKK